MSIFLIACPWAIPCKEEEKIDKETKDYCLFGEESYWLYQDSATLKIDSVVIDNPISHKFLLEEAESCDYSTEIFAIKGSFFSYDSTFFFHVRLLPSSTAVLSDDGFITYYHNGQIGEGFGTKLKEKRNNYLINGIVFNNIKIFEYYHLGHKEIYYWAKHVGLIRMEIYENDTVIVRNLIKYNVKPYNQ